MRASAVVNRLVALHFPAFRVFCQVLFAERIVSVLSNCRPRHCRARTLSSISAMFNPLPLRDVGSIRSLRAKRCEVAASKVTYKLVMLCVLRLSQTNVTTRVRG